MGLFLTMTGVIDASSNSVQTAVSDYAISRGGELTPISSKADDSTVFFGSEGNVTIVHERYFHDEGALAAHLSTSLKKPVFFLHIHDGDLWVYELFERGESTDRFNTIPHYWGPVSDEERQRWAGNAAIVGAATHQPQQYVERYLRHLTEEQQAEGGRAYPEDAFEYGQDWQVTDFMRAIGLTYPFGDAGELLAGSQTFRLVCGK